MDYKRIGRRFGTNGLLIYAAIAAFCVLTARCQKIFIVGDETVYAEPEAKTDTLSFRTFVTDGVLRRDSTVGTMPGVDIYILKGEELLYDVYYSIDGGGQKCLKGCRRDELMSLDCSDAVSPGTHRVQGSVTNTFVKRSFTVKYDVTVETE